ncbi:MAG: hypothetical protein GEV28_07670 [Actinophytocola sp.]|uniref:hypothetical protein n=1 Tax=Actinophytocola sp. TaxID=1872138 RepID=UPI00132C7922|nr:hypothetical protein [Actinophytocola sp.]MPZ80268.1 hypothetical protein [Actinophytocola sp.]
MVEIPDCRMEASVTRDRAFVFNLGWPHDTTTFVFQRRRALRRFVRLASDILAAPSPNHDPTDASTEIISAPD